MSQPAAEFHCAYPTTPEEARGKAQYIFKKYGRFADGRPVIELGCGDGVFLGYLKELGHQVLGIESNAELAAMARAGGVAVRETDLVAFLQSGEAVAGVYLYIDVIEHVPFEANMAMLAAVPSGSRLIIQTPNTRSLRGHEMYMNVPSHLAPYAPWVIKQMLLRHGYTVVEEGSVDGPRIRGLRRRIARFVLRLFKLEPELILGGGNYYVVADRRA